MTSLTAIDVAIGAGLVVVAGVVSAILRLGIERRLAIAALRTTVQLALLGQVLTWVFRQDHPWVVAALIAVMVGVAGRSAVDRPSRTYPGAVFLAAGTMAVTCLTVTGIVTRGILTIEPWYRPQIVIPLLGMMLGNSLTGVSLCLDHFLESLDTRRALVEADLALGATRWEAARGPMSEAVRRGMIPIMNTMTVAGIVALPGMMTGQILAGADPMQAVLYQILIMFMVAATTCGASVLMTYATYRRLFGPDHRLRRDLIRPK